MAFIPPIHICAMPEEWVSDAWMPLESTADTNEFVITYQELIADKASDQAVNKWKDQPILGCSKPVRFPSVSTIFTPPLQPPVEEDPDDDDDDHNDAAVDDGDDDEEEEDEDDMDATVDVAVVVEQMQLGQLGTPTMASDGQATPMDTSTTQATQT